VTSASGRTVDAPDPVVTAFRTGTTACDTAPDSTCTSYNVRGSNLPPNSTVTAYCQFSNAGGPWGASQFPHDASVNGNGDFTGNSACHVGVNTRLRYEVRSGGNSYYTDPVTR
jgi:hypothetical protein